jgi:hypothetical protein
MSVKIYSLADDGDTLLSPHFKVHEFKCQDLSDRVLIDERLPGLLEAIRTYYRGLYPKAVIVLNSAYRTEKHNRAVGGEKNSYHVRGMAVDFKVVIEPAVKDASGKVITPAKKLAGPRVFRDIDEGRVIGKHVGGLGRYNNFTHIDVRGYHSRWFRVK